jgi:hypothetical protein
MVKIIVEGNDDKNFLISFLHHLDIKDPSIIQMGGKSALLDPNNKQYKTLGEQVEKKKIKKVLFVFDCDFEENDSTCGGIEKSHECFKNLKQTLGWNIEIDVYIFDRNLDYFLIETIKDKECYEHFDNLVTCLDVETVKPNKKPIANLYRDLYPYPKFDFSHPNFDDLKSKLLNLFE